MSRNCVNCDKVLPERPLWQLFCSADCFRIADGNPKPVDKLHWLKMLELLAGAKDALKQCIRDSVQSGGELLGALTLSIDGGALVDAVEPGWKLRTLRALTGGKVTSITLTLLRATLRDGSIKNDPEAIRLAIERFPETAKKHPHATCVAIFNAVSTVSNKDLAVGTPALVECLWRILESGSDSEACLAGAVLGRFAAGDGSSERISLMMCGDGRLNKLMERAIGLSPEGASHMFADLGLVTRNFAMKLEVEHIFATNPQFVACLFSRAICDHDLEPGSEALCALINIGMNPKVREYFVANLDAAAFGKIALILMRHARRPDSLIKWVRFLSNLFGVKGSICPLALRLRACAPMVLLAPKAVISAPPADNARVCASGYEMPNFGPAPDLKAILCAIEELIAALAHTPDVREVMRMATVLTYTVYCFDDALGMEFMRRLGVAALGGAARTDADLQVTIRDCAEGKLNPASLLGQLGTKPVVVERAVCWPDVHKALQGCRSLADVLLEILKLNIEGSFATPADDIVFARKFNGIFDDHDASAQYADGLRLTAPRPGRLGPVQPMLRGDVLKWIMHVLNMLTRDCRGAEAAPLRECRGRFEQAIAKIGCVSNMRKDLKTNLMAIFVPPLQSARQRMLAARKLTKQNR